MKILKIFGVVVGIHAFALILIFANPGCSSSGSKSAPTASDTVILRDQGGTPSPVTTAANDSSSPVSVASSPSATDLSATSPTIRFSPTRPGTTAAVALETTPVGDVTPASTYTVAKGDSLWTIAKKHHLTVSEVATTNNLKPGATVHVGQKLLIPSKAPASGSARINETPANPSTVAEAAPAPKASRESVRHVVKPGETLGAIARKYQVKVGEIATANNISDPAKIRPGMELIIPGWQAPGAKTAKSGTAPATAKAPADAPEQPAATPPANPSDSVPTVVIPPTDQDLDSGVKPTNNEPPVIKVDEKEPGKL
jgi:LysM repeat protein